MMSEDGIEFDSDELCRIAKVPDIHHPPHPWDNPAAETNIKQEIVVLKAGDLVAAYQSFRRTLLERQHKEDMLYREIKSHTKIKNQPFFSGGNYVSSNI